MKDKESKIQKNQEESDTLKSIEELGDLFRKGGLTLKKIKNKKIKPIYTKETLEEFMEKRDKQIK